MRLLFGIPVHADQRHVGTLRGVTIDLPHSQGVCQRGVNSRDVPQAVSASIAIQSPSNARTGQADSDKSSVTTPAATTGTVARASRTRLPKTASTVPMFGVIGVVAIRGAVSLYLWRIRTARDRTRM
ncbi:MAG TPA: hypothetical protein VGX46_08815 [Vicinamibacterales bacterium]|nr:hypothetical protein [Vicinamibacterales bacterium]